MDLVVRRAVALDRRMTGRYAYAWPGFTRCGYPSRTVATRETRRTHEEQCSGPRPHGRSSEGYGTSDGRARLVHHLPRTIGRLGVDGEAVERTSDELHVVGPVEIHATGDVLDVPDVRQLRLGEPQQRERALRGVSAALVRHDLHRDVRHRRQLEHLVELGPVHLAAADRPVQHRLVDHGPQL